jgi:hypothetical protein
MSLLSSAVRCRGLRRLLHGLLEFELQFSTLGSEFIFTPFDIEKWSIKAQVSIREVEQDYPCPRLYRARAIGLDPAD